MTIRILIGVACAWLCAAQASAAIVREGIASSLLSQTTPASLECGTNPNRYALIWVTYDSVQAFATTVTRGGDTLTKIAESAIPPALGAGQYLALYQIVNPATGAVDVSEANDSAVAAMCWSGVDQSTPAGTPDVITLATQTGLTSSAIASAVGDIVASGVAVDNRTTGQLSVSGTGQTERIDLGSGAYAVGASESDGDTSVTAIWAWGAGRNSSIITVNVNAAASAAAPRHNMGLLGVGR